MIKKRKRKGSGLILVKTSLTPFMMTRLRAYARENKLDIDSMVQSIIVNALLLNASKPKTIIQGSDRE